MSVQFHPPAEDSCTAPVFGLFQLDRFVSLLPLLRGLLKCLQINVPLVLIASSPRSHAANMAIAMSTTASASVPRVGVE